MICETQETEREIPEEVLGHEREHIDGDKIDDRDRLQDKYTVTNRENEPSLRPWTFIAEGARKRTPSHLVQRGGRNDPHEV